MQITFGELTHLLKCVCRYGLFVCVTIYGSFLVETLSSILMGTQCAPEIANCVGAAGRLRLIHEVGEGRAPSFWQGTAVGGDLREVQCPYTDPKQLLHSIRYIDDLGELFWGSRAQVADARFWLGSWFKLRLNLDLEFADLGLVWVPWLAVSVASRPEAGHFRIRPYSKPGNVYAFTHAASYVPDGAKMGIVIGQALAAENRTDNLVDLRAEWRMCYHRLLFKCYKPEFIDRLMRRWLRKRAKGRGKQRRNSFHSVLSQDQMHESFVVTDHIDSFRPQQIRQEISNQMGIECKIAVRYHPAVGDTLRGKAKAIDLLKSLRRQRHSEVPASVAQLWADADETERDQEGSLFYFEK